MLSKLVSRLRGGQKSIVFNIDHQPRVGENWCDVLQGWVVYRFETVTLELLIDNIPIIELLPNLPRLDLYSAFQSKRFTPLCGFEFEFPLRLLEQIKTGRVKLIAKSATLESVLWTWQGSGQVFEEQGSTPEQENAIFELIGFLKSKYTNKNTFKIKNTKKSVPDVSVHIVINLSGNYSQLRKNLKLVKQFQFKVNFSSLTLILAEKNDHNHKRIKEILSEINFLDDRVVKIIDQEEFKSWQLLQSMELVGDDSNMVLCLSDQVEIAYLNLAALISDFLEIARPTILMPMLFGGEDGISGPRNIHLADLYSSTTIEGFDVAALFKVDQLGPVWLTDFRFLKEVTKEIAGQKNFKSLLPPDKTYPYYVDLRQPITNALYCERAFLPNYKKPAQEVLNCYLQYSVDPQETTKVVVFLLPESWEEKTSAMGWQYQVLTLANQIRKQGYVVYYVQDVEREAVSGYLEGHPIIALNDFIIKQNQLCPDTTEGWIIATHWQTIRAANVIRYLTGFELTYFIQQLGLKYHSQKEIDQYDNVKWSYLGTYFPLINSDLVRNELMILSDNAKFAVDLPLSLNKEVFFKQTEVRQEKSLLCLIAGEKDRGLLDYDLLKETIKQIKTLLPEIRITVASFERIEFTEKDLLTLVNERYENLTPGLAAQLFSSHQIVLDCYIHEGFNLLPLEAMACGAIPAVIFKTGSMSYLKDGENSLTFDFESDKKDSDSAQKIALRMAEVFNQTTLCQKLKAAGVKTVAETPNFLENIFDQIKPLQKQMLASKREALKKRNKVSVIIPVYCALDSLILCVRSLLKCLPDEYKVILVNDASDRGTSDWLRVFCSQHPQIQLIELTKNMGFVQACIAGVQAAEDNHDIVLLNSDVILSEGCLSRLQDAVYSRYNVGIASALSTNSPHLQLDLNPGDSLNQAAEIIDRIHQPQYPTVITPEGQLFYLKREVINNFGFFDPVYGRGFCEESDLCMRVFLNGIDMVCADNALIFHKRSASFGKQTRSELISKNRPIFDGRWQRYYMPVYFEFKRRDPISTVRKAYYQLKQELEKPLIPYTPADIVPNSPWIVQTHSQRHFKKVSVLKHAEVVFILPSIVLGGGTLSVLQHADELQMRGIETRVITFFETEVIDRPFQAPAMPLSIDQILNLDWSQQKVVATFWTTAYLVKALVEKYPKLRPYYYIQDYEPWFYSHPEEFPTVKKAERTYELGLKSIAKTHFLRETIKKYHNVDLEVITPGIDHSVFYPGDQDQYFERPRLAALFRPQTARRGNKELLTLLLKLSKRVPEVEFNLFGQGCEEDLPVELHGRTNFKGQLLPDQVGKLYRNSDVVIDLSYWHGFGRIGLEAMASGAVPVLSASGGIDRYAVDGVNSFVVDLQNFDLLLERTTSVLKDRQLRMRLRESAIKTSRQFTETKAVDDWVHILGLSTSKIEKERMVELSNTQDLSAQCENPIGTRLENFQL